MYKAGDVKLDELILKHEIVGSGNRAGMTFWTDFLRRNVRRK